jgi:uncharacterized protein (DUF433 family)
MSVINCNPRILGGTPVFHGTRVPIATLFEYLAHDGMADFYADFPGVTKAQVDALLEEMPGLINRLPSSGLLAAS